MIRKRILMVAGEASADRHASKVIRSLQGVFEEVEIFGMGGPFMKASGMECCYGMDELSVMGFSDVLPRIRRIHEVYKGIQRLITSRKPDIVIPVDLPDFNMRVARFARKNNTKVLYYIAPQAWAWRSYRAGTLREITDGLAVIFPFEEEFFSGYGVNARYVGHPLMEDLSLTEEAAWPVKRIAILPGSRYHEIRQILPIMLGAKHIVQEKYPDITWHLPVAPGLDINVIAGMADNDIHLTESLPRVDLAMVKSGTSCFEMAIQCIPAVICYRTSAFNYLLARSFVKTRFIGMPNIIMGKAIAPELIQDELNEKALAKELLKYITDRSLFLDAVADCKNLRERMGDQRSDQEVARWVTELL
ncbi:MAG TPA: lipid-A-disaccharide synthase [Deltaproteobacteria bacterium]|nr:lipid-A-disaccharide synthase [Deltaproteobacteria bacterium]